MDGQQGLPVLPPEKTPAEVFTDGKRQLVGLTREELADWMAAALGEPRYRARQLFEWLHRRGVRSFDAMTNLPAALRQRLEQVATAVAVEPAQRHEATRTQTSKHLLRLTADGEQIEAVLMEHHYGHSACVTTQVGCRMGCTFCASTFGGLVRNLTAAEIVDQLLVLRGALPRGQRIGSVVLMGSGEPLENYDNVVRAVRLMHDPAGLDIGYRHITVSTSGLVPGMRRLAGEGLPITLALSLHAPDDELRSRLMPVGRIWSVAECMAAAREYAERTGRRITVEYLLIAGVNDQPERAGTLARLLRGMLAHVNLIPMNPVAERPEYRRPGTERVRRFQDTLAQAGVTATIRREMGSDIDAACGQLRHRAQRRRPGRSGRTATPASR